MWPVLELHRLPGQWLAAKFRTSSMRVLNFFFRSVQKPFAGPVFPLRPPIPHPFDHPFHPPSALLAASNPE